MASASRLQVVDAVQSCLTSGKYSDLTIKCRDDVYKVHKMIVCTRSGFFAGAMRFGGQEAQHDMVDLSEDEPKVIASLVQYLYSGEYDNDFCSVTQIEHAEPLNASQLIITRGQAIHPVHGYQCTYAFPHTCQDSCSSSSIAMGPGHNWVLCPHHACSVNCRSNCKSFICKICCKARGPPSQLLGHSKMYAIADKYDVTGLKGLASTNFRLACSYFWNDDAFAVAIDHVFSSTVAEDTHMRNSVIQMVSVHMAIFKKPEIQALVSKHGDLAIGILLKKMG